MQNKISNKPTNKPVKPDVKNQAAGKHPILNYIGYNNKAYGSDKEPMTAQEIKMGKVIDEYGNVESATDRIRDPEFFQKKLPVKKSNKLSDTRSANAAAFYQPTNKMSATRSWQIIKQSMSKDELEEHYRDHPKERPIEVTPYKLDEGLTQMLGEDWITE
jgi:hypothetical protein